MLAQLVAGVPVVLLPPLLLLEDGVPVEMPVLPPGVLVVGVLEEVEPLPPHPPAGVVVMPDGGEPQLEEEEDLADVDLGVVFPAVAVVVDAVWAVVVRSSEVGDSPRPVPRINGAPPLLASTPQFAVLTPLPSPRLRWRSTVLGS